MSDFFGGVFTVLTAPIMVFCPDNPTFRKNNPFRRKVWEEQEGKFCQHEQEKEQRIGRKFLQQLPLENEVKDLTKNQFSKRNQVIFKSKGWERYDWRIPAF